MQVTTGSDVDHLETIFARHLRCYDLVFDEKDIVCLTDVMVPSYVKFIVSLGKKFAYMPGAGMKPGHEFDFFIGDAQLYAKESGQVQFVKHRMPKIVRKSLNKATSFPQAMTSIKFWLGETKKFLRENKALLVTTADKGGKLVIIDRNVYKEKLGLHVKENIDNGTYGRPDTGYVFEEIRDEFERRHKMLRDRMNPILEADRWKKMCFEPFIMAKLVLTIKVHKEGYPTRPIVAAADRWNKSLSRWLLRLLTFIAERFSSVKVKNSEQFRERLADVCKLPDGHKLSTWDYSAMFTNVPYYVPREIVADSFYVVKDRTSATLDDILNALDFVIESSSFFVCDGKICKQEKGLTMGNELSQVLADIATNKAAIMVRASINEQRISFVYKYIDDFASAMDEEAATMFQNRMNKAIDGLKLVMTAEDDKHEIFYLDMAIKRVDDNSLLHRWYQKDCAKGSILNFFSNHPLSMRKNIVKEYIRHALEVTSPQLYGDAIKKLEKVLRKSSYPWSMIRSATCNVLAEIGSTHLTSVCGSPDIAIDCDYEICSRMRKDELQSFVGARGKLEKRDGAKGKTKAEGKSKGKFVAAPFYDRKSFNAMKRCMKESRIDVALAPSPLITNATEKVFSYMKMDSQYNLKKFAVFSMYCMTCGKDFDAATGNVDLGRFIERLDAASKEISKGRLENTTWINGINVERTMPLKHLVENRNHVLDFEPDDVICLRTAERMDAVLEIRMKARR